MKENKFRAIRIDGGGWVEGSLINGSDNSQNPQILKWEKSKHGVYLSEIHAVYSNTVCQLTGMKDKDGVNIWEGDKCALHCEYTIDDVNYDVTHYGVVKYTPSIGYHLSVYKTIDNDNDLELIHPKIKNIVQYRTTVIGTIHK